MQVQIDRTLRKYINQNQCRRHGGLWWAYPPKHSSNALQIEIWNTINKQIFAFKALCTNVKPPIEDFLAMVLIESIPCLVYSLALALLA